MQKTKTPLPTLEADFAFDFDFTAGLAGLDFEGGGDGEAATSKERIVTKAAKRRFYDLSRVPTLTPGTWSQPSRPWPPNRST